MAPALHISAGTDGNLDEQRTRSDRREMATTRTTRKPTPTVHLPLRRIALCLDCEECFEIGFDACPACGCETWVALARFLDKEPPPDDRPRPGVRHGEAFTLLPTLTRKEDREISRHLLIVARNRPDLYDQLRQAFAGSESVQVIVDRRSGQDRRSGAKRPAVNGFQIDRRGPVAERRRRNIEEQLRTIGWALVLRPGRK